MTSWAPVYELYMLTPEGRIDHIVPVDAETDETAEAIARANNHSHWVELWTKDRLVGRYPPGPQI